MFRGVSDEFLRVSVKFQGVIIGVSGGYWVFQGVSNTDVSVGLQGTSRRFKMFQRVYGDFSDISGGFTWF